MADPQSNLTRASSAGAQRARIRRATGELIAKRGYAGVTVELIVKRARVSYKTFYKHYSNKEEAFVDLFERTATRVEDRAVEALEGASVEWPEQVAIVLRTFFEAIIADPLIARACLVEGPTAGPEIVTRHEKVVRAFVPVLRQGREFNPEAAALPESIEDTLAGSILWSAYQRLVLSETDRIAELIPENVELVLRPYIGDAEASRIAAASLAKTPAG